MATQGLRDHIGGGFFRYTVDPDWQTPHFEKMLYDNAQLACLYLDAAKVFNRRDFEAIGKETLNFMLREMSGKNGAMVSSLSAVDDHNIEGGFYLWSRETLKNLLTEKEYQVAELLWNLQQPTHFDAGYLPRHAMNPDQVAAQLGLSPERVMNILVKAQSKLFAARKSRVVPVDRKQCGTEENWRAPKVGEAKLPRPVWMIMPMQRRDCYSGHSSLVTGRIADWRDVG